MRLFSWLQEHAGFTRSEILVLLFLSTTFLAGNAVRWYRRTWEARTELPPYDYSSVDSEFVARSRSQLSESPPPARALELESIDLNSATLEELVMLPGIGPSTAQKILQYRQEQGPFTSAEELLEVQGIGVKKLERIRPFLAPCTP
jgi:competence ComEA-like helix-hairpin-helix protein